MAVGKREVRIELDRGVEQAQRFVASWLPY